MLTRTQDNEEIIERAAALDAGETGLMCCLRVPDGHHRGKRRPGVRADPAMTRSLVGMSGHLACRGVTRVVLEATSGYGKPVCCLLDAAGFGTWLAGAEDAGHRPGRPKTGQLDAVWLAKLTGRQMLRPGFVPPPVRRLRDRTRSRAGLVAARTADKQRAEKLPDDAGITLSAVAAGLFGVSGRDMPGALVAGERDPRVLAQLARRTMRAKITVPEGGVHRPLHRPSRVPARRDAGPGRCDQRRHRRAPDPDRGLRRPARRPGGPAR